MRSLRGLFASVVLVSGLAACSNQTTNEDSNASIQQQKQQQAQQLAAQKAKQQQLQRQRQQQAQQKEQPKVVRYGGKGVGNYSAAGLGGDFAGNRQLIAFIENMVRNHGFNRNYLYGVFSQVRDRDDVSRLWSKPSAGSPRGWNAYRSRFVNEANIRRGVQFWKQYGAHLRRAQQRYGVEAQYIVGIMGVETRWGRILGKHRVIDALTTSAITNKRRSKFFFKELKNYMLMTRTERMDPLAPKGSFAGAMGYGQFMPSSFRAYAVDFNGDGIRDLWNPVDAIGSIANYFAKHNWKRGTTVAVPAHATSPVYSSIPDGFKVKYTLPQLAKYGITPRYGRYPGGRVHFMALSTVPGGYKEPWIGYNNYYTITRYNHSNYYAMSVHLLSEAIYRRLNGKK